MGSLCGKCIRHDEEDYYARKSYLIFPAELMDSRVSASDENDEKFQFIRNEAEIDKAINYLDERMIMSEEEASDLDRILNELRVMRKKFLRRPSEFFSRKPSQENTVRKVISGQ